MPVSTNTFVTLRCLRCSQWSVHSLSRFACGQKGQVELFCTCGQFLMVLSRQAPQVYFLGLGCFLCRQSHVLKRRGSEIWSKDVRILFCENTGAELAYFGAVQQLQEILQKEQYAGEKSFQELGLAQYFVNPTVMFAVLECLRERIKKGRVYCSCGQRNLTTEIFPDRVELRCTVCRALGIIFAETLVDLQRLQASTKLVLEAYACRYLDKNRLKK